MGFALTDATYAAGGAATRAATDDATGAADNPDAAHLDFTFYPGTDTQDPDPTIEADMGVGDTPAFRGWSYVVFSRLALERFGNMIPNMMFEVVADGEFDADYAVTSLGADHPEVWDYLHIRSDGELILIEENANDFVFAVADRGELVAHALADLGEGLGAGLGEGGALGAELVDLVVREIDLVLELGADAFEAVDLKIEGRHLLAGGGEERLGLLALRLAAGELRAEGIEGFLEILGVLARGGLGRFELGGVGVGVAAGLGDGFFEIGGVGPQIGEVALQIGGVRGGLRVRGGRQPERRRSRIRKRALLQGRLAERRGDHQAPAAAG